MSYPLAVESQLALRPAASGAAELARRLRIADDQASELLLKTLITGEQSGTSLSDRMCLPYSILEGLLEHARVEKLVEVRGAAGTGSAGYRYALTDLGRDRAGHFLDSVAVHRARARAARAVRRLHARADGRPRLSSIASGWSAVSRTSSSAATCSSSSARR